MTSKDLFNLSGKIALVSGASRGIGEGVACCLANHGAHVIVSSRKAKSCQAVVEMIRAAGGSADAMACHVGEIAQIEHLFDAITERYGRLDILVNNAATNPYWGPIADTNLSAFEKTVDVNIRGYFFMSCRAVKLMSTHGSGSIVNVASVNGVTPAFFQGIYSITKAAVVSMTKAFAHEYASQGIRVNALLPGATDTRFASALVQNPSVLKKVLEHIPLGRIAEPDEMAGAVLYLVSPAASYTTGVCLNVDGGYLIS